MIGAGHDPLVTVGMERHTPVLSRGIHISSRVTVFAAAAGFGKTYAMLEAYSQLKGEGASVAWLSCTGLALPSGDVLEGIRLFLAVFAEAETVFVDDLDCLSSKQRRALLQAFVLTAPFRKIVLATRTLDHLGVARLLAGGAVSLVQPDTLRWRRRELSQLWQGRLTAKQIGVIDGVAQGWPAVSQLLARAMIKEGDLPGEATLLNDSLVADYVREEVLADFDPTALSLLAMTSVVDDFDDALIRKLFEAAPFSCDDLVRRLPGLCVYERDGSRVAYNRALSIYLQLHFKRLPDKTRTQALLQAADWASAGGDVVAAANLAAQAGDRRRIVDYVTRAGGLRIWMARGVDDVRSVIGAAGEALVADEPRLQLLKCVILLKDGRVSEAVHLYQAAARSLASDDETQRAAAFVRLSLIVYGCGLAAMSDGELETAVRSFDKDPFYRTVAPTVLAMMHSQHANFDAATTELGVARSYAREAGTAYNLLFLDLHSAVVALAGGNLADARMRLSKARLRWRANYPNDHGAETVMLCLEAQFAFERGNIPQAKRAIGPVGHRLAHSEAWLDVYFAGYEPMFRLIARDQGLAGALAAIDRSVVQLREVGLDRIAVGLRNIGACLTGEGILMGASGLHLPDGDDAPGILSESWQEKEFRLLALAYARLADGKAAAAVRALDGLIAFADKSGLQRTKLRALLLRQVAFERLHDARSSSRDFAAAVDIGEATGLRQAFLEFGGNLIESRMKAVASLESSAFTKGLTKLLASARPTQASDALTRREAEILELLDSIGSDKGIARQLSVTEYAVRFHIKNIYRKLGVHDRSSAIERYRNSVRDGFDLQRRQRDLPK